ncbi:permease [Enterovibrio norvegicus FF-162]|uniref:hypothetical protein n=1 Tax=Enterovibrio norvegicus TaxID=188144 RepID=UPI0003159766|nr:hypothetical protein [Enterovibrio norvegicus]OEE79471.1 permease [Enterovibrio norvegicus FF-162]
MSPTIEVKLKDSLVSALINGVINAVIASYTFGSKALVPMSLDMISTKELSVWGQAVPLTFGLGIILSLITAKVFAGKVSKVHPELKETVTKPIFPTLLVIAINNAAFLFGWFVVLAILWTRVFGEVYVSSWLASALVGVFAVIVTVLVETRTKKAVLKGE